MGYRGADLDLRTSRTWSAGSTDLMSGFDSAPQGVRPPHAGPIWVDETLLASANHAFDVALAHRAGEVRLEHLLHALTRVEAAAAALETCGVRVLPLRRDAAIVIASEIPVGLSEEGGSPRRSPELEEALRLAAAHAAHAGRPAGVDHLLHVLIDLRSDLAGAELLLRHLTRPSRDFWSPLGPRTSPYAGAAHLLDVSEADRPRNSAGTAHLARPARRAEQRSPAEYTILQGMLDRLVEIERAMSDRLEAVEAALAATGPAAPLDLKAVSHRLDAVEDAVLAPDGEAGGLKERLSALEKALREERAERALTLSSLAADVKALATALGCSGADGETPSIAQRLQLLAADLEQHRIELGSSLGDRIAAIEKALEAHGEKEVESHAAYGEELAEVHEAIMKLNLNQHTLAGSIEQWRSNDAGEIHLINARIGALQEDGARRLQLLERLCADVEALSPSSPGEKAPRRSFRYWLFGTDDWVKASWRPRSKPKA
jgi:hypothetical protein